MEYLSTQLFCCFVLASSMFFFSKGSVINFPPYFTQEPNDTIAQKNKPLVLECKVKGNPKPTITWYQNDQQLIPDDRRSVLPDGSLYFKSILHTKGNRPDEGLYRCTASSQFNSQSYAVSSRTVKLRVAGLSSKVIIEPSSLRVLYGDMARILCKIRHSIPKAAIEWTYKYTNGTTKTIALSRKHTMLDNGVLQIASIKFTDDGEYSCTAHNRIAQRTHTSGYMVLTVEPDQGLTRRPEFIGKPVDTNATKGSSVVLECASTGRPTPKVQWYKDGTLLSYDNRIKLHGISNLMISNVTSSDEGLYECKISSGSLTKKASAKLSVHYPPTFLTKPQNKNYARVNDDVTFKCIVGGKPTPSISWLKNGQPCVASDFISISNTSLQVESILTVDTGIYQCVGKNYLGEIQAPAELAVFHKDEPIPTIEPASTTKTPTVATTTARPTTTQSPTTTPSITQGTTTSPPKRGPGKPENLKAKALSETAIELSWDPPSETGGQILSYTIFISFNTGAGASNDQKTTKGDVHKLVLNNLVKNTQYTFVVYALSNHGNGQLATVTAWTASRNRPGIPLSLTAKGTSSSQIRVQWQEPTSGSAVKEYVLEYQQISGGANYTLYSTIISRKHKTIKNLKTYTSYKIWVYAVDDAGHRSHPAEITAKTMGGVPKGKPLDVMVIGDSSGTALIVTWKPPSFDAMNGDITKYLLEYRKPEQQDAVSIDVLGVLIYKLTNLDRNTIYEVRLKAGNPSGYGDYSLWTPANTSVIKCSETQSPGQPTEVEVSSPVQGFPEIKVTWQPPVDVSQRCVTGYRIAYGEGAPFPFKQKVNASTRAYPIRYGIIPGREYVIKIEAINSKGINGRNVQKKIKIPPVIIVLRKAVKNVRAVALSSGSVKVSWMDYNSHQPYLYHVYHVLQKTMVYCGNTTQLSITCSGLKPYTFYTFIVRRLNEKTNATVTNRTMEAKPSPPLDITGRLSEDNISDLILSWQIPDRVNGKILKYRIFYTMKTSLPTKKWMKKDITGNTLNARITNLELGVKYYFKIKAQNGAGWSDFSKIAMIPTYNKTKDPGKGDAGKGNTNALAGPGTGLKDKTLWIVIAAVAGVTLIAIIIISVVLCKKRSGEDSSPRKRPPTYKAAVMANGSSKKKHKDNKKPDLWINQSENVAMKPLLKYNTDVTNIPRSSTEMKPLDDHPIDKIKLDHERSSFRKGSRDVDSDLPPPPPQLLAQDDEDDLDAASPIAIPSYSPYKPVVSYPRNVAPDEGTAQLSYPDYPLTSTPRHVNGMPRSESFDNTREPNHTTPLLRSHSDDIDHQTPIYAVPKPRNKNRPANEDQRYQTPVVPPLPKPYSEVPVGYSIPNGVGRTAPSDTKDVVADLDSQLAGLEGLMKDLKEITSRDLLT